MANEADKDHKGWKQCADMDKNSSWHDRTNNILYSDHEFLSGVGASIDKYDTLTDKWTAFVRLEKDKNLFSGITAICLHKIRDTLYMTFARRYIGILNIKTKVIETVPINVDLGNAPCLIILNDELNIIGGHQSNKHYIWNNKTKKLVTKHTFTHVTLGIVGARIVYQSSSNKLVMFGGYDNGKYGRLNCILTYDINENKWKENMNVLPFKINTFGCVMTMNEKYACILGGITNNTIGMSDTIYIVDLKTMETKLSNIKCPELALYNAVLMTTENEKDFLLVNGYVKQMCNNKNMFVPNDIIELICVWYKAGYVHLISTKGKHWNICIDNIF